MKKFFLSALVVGLSLASCTTVTKTASTLDVATGLEAQSTADLSVSSQKITYTHHTISAERKGGKQNVINAAIQAALAQNGNADVLVAPQYVLVKKKGLFGSKYRTVIVSGYPATYKNFKVAR